MSDDIFEDARQKRAKLLSIFETLPSVIVYGVVGASGPSAGKIGRDTHWWLNLDLVAWRIPGEPVSRGKLSISKELVDGELSELRGAIKAESVIAFIGKVCESSPFGDTRALLVNLLEKPKDAELESMLADYSKPVEIFDPIIGRLVLDKSVDWFEGKISWLGKQIDISLSNDDGGAPWESVRTAKSLLEAMDVWSKKVNDFAVAELLELKNDDWLSDDEKPISRETFIDRMQLKSITAYPDGAFTFWHDDGGLFWGHSIEVRGSLSGGLRYADIPG